MLEEAREALTTVNLEPKESKELDMADITKILMGDLTNVNYGHIINPAKTATDPKILYTNGRPKHIAKGMFAVFAIPSWGEYKDFTKKMDSLMATVAPWLWTRHLKTFLTVDCGDLFKQQVADTGIVANVIHDIFYEMEEQCAKSARLGKPMPVMDDILKGTAIVREIGRMSQMAAAMYAQRQISPTQGEGSVKKKAKTSNGKKPKRTAAPTAAPSTGTKNPAKKTEKPARPAGKSNGKPGGYDPKWKDGEDADYLRTQYLRLGKCFHHFLNADCYNKLGGEWGAKCCRKGVDHENVPGCPAGQDNSAFLIKKRDTAPKGMSTPKPPQLVVKSNTHTVVDSKVKTAPPVQHEAAPQDTGLEPMAATNGDEEPDTLPTFSTKRRHAADFDEVIAEPFPRPNEPEATVAGESIKPFVFKGFVCSSQAMSALTKEQALKIGFPKNLGGLIPHDTLHSTDDWIRQTFATMDSAGLPQRRNESASGANEVYVDDPAQLYVEEAQYGIVWDIRKVKIDPYKLEDSTTDRGFITPMQLDESPPRTLNRAKIAEDLKEYPGQDIRRQLAGLGFEEPYDSPVVLSLSPIHKGAAKNMKQFDKLNDTALKPENAFIMPEKYSWLAYYPSSIHPSNVLDQSTPEKEKWRDTHDESWKCQCESADDSTSPNDLYRESEHVSVHLPRPHEIAKAIRILKSMVPFMPKEWSEERKNKAVQFFVLDFSAYYKRVNNHPRFWSRHQRLIRTGSDGARKTHIMVENSCMFGSGYLPYLAQNASNAYLHTVRRKFLEQAPPITEQWVLNWQQARREATKDKAGSNNDDHMWSSVYIDDTLSASLMEQTSADWVPLTEILRIAKEVAASWGLPLSIAKLVGPTVEGLMLGVLLNAEFETMYVSEARRNKYAAEAHDIADATRVLKSTMKTLLHKLIWTAAVCMPELAAIIMPLFYPTRYKYKSHKGWVTMTDTLKAKWKDVATTVEASSGIAMMPTMKFPKDDEPNVMVAFTDASGDGNMGMGGVCHPYYWTTQFREHERELSVPVKEYLAMNIMYQLMAKVRSEPFMAQYTDSDNGKCGHEASKSKADMLARMIREGHKLEVKLGVKRKVRHLKREKNQESDDLSKLNVPKFKRTARSRGYRGPLMQISIPEYIRDTRALFEAKEIEKETEEAV